MTLGRASAPTQVPNSANGRRCPSSTGDGGASRRLALRMRSRRCLTDRRPDALPSVGHRPDGRCVERPGRLAFRAADSWPARRPPAQEHSGWLRSELHEQPRASSGESRTRPGQAHDLACRRRPPRPRRHLPGRLPATSVRSIISRSCRGAGFPTPSVRSSAAAGHYGPDPPAPPRSKPHCLGSSIQPCVSNAEGWASSGRVREHDSAAEETMR